MPKAKTHPELPDKRLEGATVLLNRVREKNTIHNIILTWRLLNYEELKSNVLYFQFYESRDIQCVLRLLKKDDSLFLCVSGSSIPQKTKAEFLIMDETTMVSEIKAADELEGQHVFATEYLNEKFLGPGKKFLKDGTLTVAFKYASDFYTSYHEGKFDDNEVLSDLDELCYDLKIMYYESIYSDFLIHAGEYSFKTHKFILASRSNYFEKFFEKNKNAEDDRLDALPGILHEVLVYIYSGELKEMDFDCMQRVYELACKLEIENLCNRCFDYFENHINVDNYEEMIKFVKKTKSTDLKNILVRFLTKNKQLGVDICALFREPPEKDIIK